MTILLIFTTLIIGLNSIPVLIKTDFPKTKKIIAGMLICSTILFITILTLKFNGYELKGFYSFSVIGCTFIILSLIYFTLFKNTKKKVLTIFLLTPLIALSILTLIYRQTLKEFRINDNTKIVVTSEGFLACGEIIRITQTRFGILDKEIHYENSLCLRGIKKIETKRFDDKHAVFLIYHNGAVDTENPYKYEIEIKNGW